jgi:hypothetical protein
MLPKTQAGYENFKKIKKYSPTIKIIKTCRSGG